MPWRSGLSRRRQHERAGRAVASPASIGARRQPPQPAQDLRIPHGGGGPGMGPIGVKAHLAPFLPGHPELDGGKSPVGRSRPHLGFGVDPADFLRLHPDDGWRRADAATEVAILNANYIAKRSIRISRCCIKNHNGRVAHECIVDPRPLEDACGVTVDDIAKRLIDYGFHAPTMSFPVPGTLMIEPTESESKAEIDRFCDAMIAIRQEISAWREGPLRHRTKSAAPRAAHGARPR
jgi:glycine dehydrogenase